MTIGDNNFSDAPSVDDKKELVQLMVGDTDRELPQMTDTIYETVLAKQPILTYAAAVIADMLKAKYARLVNVTSGATSVAHANKFSHYRQLAIDLRAGGAGDLPGGDGTGSPTVRMLVGGISRSQREDFYEDDDRIQPSFRLGKDDNPKSPSEFDDLDRRD